MGNSSKIEKPSFRRETPQPASPFLKSWRPHAKIFNCLKLKATTNFLNGSSFKLKLQLLNPNCTPKQPAHHQNVARQTSNRSDRQADRRRRTSNTQSTRRSSTR